MVVVYWLCHLGGGGGGGGMLIIIYVSPKHLPEFGTEAFVCHKNLDKYAPPLPSENSDPIHPFTGA